MPEYQRDEVTLYYEVQGSGRPIVFTHGASWNHKQWQRQVEYFSPYYQTIVWDVRGHGGSNLPSGKVDPEDFSRDLIHLLDTLKIERAVLCGLSMGGHISLQTAVRYPQRVDGLVLIGTPFTNAFNWYEKIFVPVNRWSNRLMPMKLAGKIQAKVLSTYNKENKIYIEEAFQSIPHNNWIRLWDAVTRMESKDDLEKVKCPTLLLQGEHDTMIRRQQKYMAENIPDSRLKIISHAHHATNLDNPQEVNEEMALFLEEIDQL
ncbi:alpha/beta fold hydrolase [Desmospora activa]|uniref:Pimeloyl-ACP methyl ester carboxylesterase n=1 Tax=Desmospora activa DSM 45169 TaxID=1121389 RepID=A0A2T4Z8I0_9BACL|nr:alpha/beta hydrolase [Desmospora activa]PTM58192.1 pimeloyl-ACP methyl ester carboxylesterase [Desmospora activa DSM 45169]